MYAVIQTGGKQYRVAEGDFLVVEKLTADVGAKVEFSEVLLVGEGEKLQVGTPLVKGATVQAEVVLHERDDKIEIIKLKRRKHHLKHQGHRQHTTKVKIKKIVA